MRVIAGSAKRLLLKTVEGLDTRPTTDRIKETLFNMIRHDLTDCLFLDLFAGSGGIGIEALSRGAQKAVFVEKSSVAAACIKENLLHTKLMDRALVMTSDVVSALARLEDKGEIFNIVFLDPPYHKDLEWAVLEYLSQSSLIDSNSLLIIETAKNTEIPDLISDYFVIMQKKVYKTNQHYFIYRKNSST